MLIPNPDLDFFPIPDPGVKKAPDPGCGSAALVKTHISLYGLSRPNFPFLLDDVRASIFLKIKFSRIINCVRRESWLQRRSWRQLRPSTISPTSGSTRSTPSGSPPSTGKLNLPRVTVCCCGSRMFIPYPNFFHPDPNFFPYGS
jgi:hypothetical protein